MPHLVVLDAIMPGADGSTVVKLIRKDDALKKIKILVFTGYPGKGEKLVKLGADYAIEKAGKEADIDSFRKVVCRLLGVKNTRVIATKPKVNNKRDRR